MQLSFVQISNVIEEKMPSFTSRKSPNNRLNELARARALITNQGNVRAGLMLYKDRAPSDELRRVLPRLLEISAYRKIVWTNAKPKSPAELRQPGLSGHTNYLREVEWLSNSLIGYSSDINVFLSLVERYETSFLFGNRDECNAIFREVEQEYSIMMV